MGLQVWLPLIGNLNNNGLGIDTVMTNNGATVSDTGKIGKSYSFDANDDFISINGDTVRDIFKGGNNPFTIAFWIYNTKTTGSRAVPFGDYGLTGTIQFNLELNSSAGNWNDDIRFYWAGNPDYRATGTSATPNTWVHLAIVYDGTKVEFYRNGILVNTRTGTLAALNKTSGAFYLGRDNRTGGTAFGGKINDFRIYDEALGLKQIREISKGLFAHYSLKGTGIGENLLTDSQLITSSAGKPSNSDQLTYCNSVTSYGYDNNEKCWKLVTPDTGNQNNGIGFSFPTADTTLGIKHGDTITFSCDIKGTTDENLPALGLWMNFKSTDTAWWQGTYHFSKKENFTSLSSTIFQRYSVTYTIPADNSNYDAFKLWTTINGNYSSTLYIKNLKLEINNKPTIWIPNKNDSIYTTLGYNNWWAMDNSGYKYNGAVTGALEYQTNSPRYNGSTYFDGSSYIMTPSDSMAWFAFDNITISAWLYPTVKPNDWTGSIGIQQNGGSNGKIFSISNYAGKFSVHTDNGSTWVTTQSETLPLNEWSHCVATLSNGTDLKMYLNGTLVKTATLDFGSATIKSDTRIAIGVDLPGDDEKYKGCYSDVRFYATSLSEQDVLALYQVCDTIDRKNNLYTYEFIENLNNMMFWINKANEDKQFTDGLSSYTQTNCQVTLTDDGYRVYRPPNLIHDRSTMHNMWGGLKININNGNWKDKLLTTIEKGHSYIILYDVKGQTTNPQTTIGWSNQMGWGGGGLLPQPTNVKYKAIPNNFENDDWQTFYYKWDLTDDIYKVCTSSYSSYTAGETYLSYREFQIGWDYNDTGSLGTDIYIKNIRMYDITNINNPKLLKIGIFKIGGLHEENEVKLRNMEIEANSFLEI